MQAAKDAVSGFLSHSGRHDTKVDEVVQPTVTSETVKPHRHEETTEAVDREVHQHHYHTTVIPVQHQETLPEKHVHNPTATEHREFVHEDQNVTQQKVAAEAARFTDASTTHDTKHTQSQAPVETGEHVHHHVHEVVQPVIHKETIQPEVVHTTVPIHEKHFAPSEHHGISMLPSKTLDEFKSGGGNITGSQGVHHHDEYEGHPRPYNKELQLEQHPVDLEPLKHYGSHDLESTGHPPPSRGSDTTGAVGSSTTAAAPHESNLANKVDPRVDSDHGASKGLGTGGAALAGAGAVAGAGAGAVAANSTSHAQDSAGTTEHGYSTGTHPVSGTQNASDSLEDRGLAAGTGIGTTAGATSQAGTGSGTTGHGYTIGTHSASGTQKVSQSLEDRGFTTGTGIGSTAGKHTSASKHAEKSTDTAKPTGTETDQSSRAAPDDTLRHETSADSHDDGKQHPSQGPDPALVEDKHSKLTGEGVDGSHSAVFGLTPDGHKYDDTHAATTPVHAAHTKDSAVASRSTTPKPEDDTGSRKPAGAGVSEQIDDPKVNEKGHGGQSSYPEAAAGDKPGSGSLSANPSQGTGDVRPGEHAK